MRAIFMSYRREDTEGQAGRLFDDLARYFGEHSVFMDVPVSSRVAIFAASLTSMWLPAAFCWR